MPPCAAAAPLPRAQAAAQASVIVAEAPVPRLERHFLLDQIQGNRSRMIQIATIALLLGLFILMRK